MFVFLMSRGQLVELDMSRAHKISSLRATLERKFGIPLDRQILLVSGGFQLEPGDNLYNYGAGLGESNPVYVFTKVVVDSPFQEKPDQLDVSDGGFPKQIELQLNVQPSLGVLEQRVQALADLDPVACEVAKAVEQLELEQRHMILGWHVALANLAEVASDTERRLTVANSRFLSFEQRVGDWLMRLSSFSALKSQLLQVPLLPQLVVGQTMELGAMHNSYELTSYNNLQPTNLYEWACRQLTTASSSLGSPTSLLTSSALTTASTTGLQQPSTTTALSSAQSTALFFTRRSESSLAPPTHSSSTPQIPLFSTPPPHPTTTSSSQPSTVSSSTYSTTHRFKPSPIVDEEVGTADLTQSYEADFLWAVQQALKDVSFLQSGSEASVDCQSTLQDDGSCYLTHAHSQIDKTNQLLAKVTSPAHSHSSPRSSPPSTMDDHDDTPSTEQPVHSETSCLLRSDSPRDPQLLQPEQALDRDSFNRHLTGVKNLVAEALELANRVTQTRHHLGRTYHQLLTDQRKQSTLPSVFQEHTIRLRSILNTFDRLYMIFREVMSGKLSLAKDLYFRQLWLQNIQSEMNNYDSVIQNCLARIKRITTTGTLLTKLYEAPENYLKSLVEVMRRQRLEKAFNQYVVSVCNKEEVKRSLFTTQMKDNILHSLFSPWTNSRATFSHYMHKLVNRSLVELIPLELGDARLRHTSGSIDHGRSHGICSSSEPRLDILDQSLPSQQPTGFGSQRDEEFVQSTRPPPSLPRPQSNRMRIRSSLDAAAASTIEPSRTGRVRTESLRLEDEVRLARSRPVTKFNLDDSWPSQQHGDLQSTGGAPSITWEDLIALRQLLPPQLAELLTKEMAQSHQHLQIALDLLPNMMTGSSTTSSRIGIARPPSHTTTSVGTQTDELGSGISSSIMAMMPDPVWIGGGDQRSTSASLDFPTLDDSIGGGVGDSSRRNYVWDKSPSSFCSWELCRVPPLNRTSFRSVSAECLFRISGAGGVSTTAVGTQTDDDSEPTMVASEQRQFVDDHNLKQDDDENARQSSPQVEAGLTISSLPSVNRPTVGQEPENRAKSPSPSPPVNDPSFYSGIDFSQTSFYSAYESPHDGQDGQSGHGVASKMQLSSCTLASSSSRTVPLSSVGSEAQLKEDQSCLVVPDVEERSTQTDSLAPIDAVANSTTTNDPMLVETHCDVPPSPTQPHDLSGPRQIEGHRPTEVMSIDFDGRYITFVHSSFVKGDIVIFVPYHSSSQSGGADAPIAGPINNPSRPLDASLLLTTSTNTGGGNQSPTCSPTPHKQPITNSPVDVPSPVDSANQLASSSSQSLALNLLTGVVGATSGANLSTSLHPSPNATASTSPLNRSSNNNNKRRFNAMFGSRNCNRRERIVQWRMLTSDGLAYFLNPKLADKWALDGWMVNNQPTSATASSSPIDEDTGSSKLDRMLAKLFPVFTTTAKQSVSVTNEPSADLTSSILSSRSHHSPTPPTTPPTVSQQQQCDGDGPPGQHPVFILAVYRTDWRCAAVKANNRFNLTPGTEFRIVNAKLLRSSSTLGGRRRDDSAGGNR